MWILHVTEQGDFTCRCLWMAFVLFRPIRPFTPKWPSATVLNSSRGPSLTRWILYTSWIEKCLQRQLMICSVLDFIVASNFGAKCFLPAGFSSSFIKHISIVFWQFPWVRSTLGVQELPSLMNPQSRHQVL